MRGVFGALGLVSLLLAGPASAADIPIDIWPGDTPWQSSALSDADVVSAIRAGLDLGPYHRVAAKVQWVDDRPRHVLVYLLPKGSYSVTLARLSLGEDGKVVGKEMNYQLSKADQEASWVPYGTCPDPSVQMIFSTCETGIETAVAGIDRAGELAAQMGFKYKLLKGSAENVAAIKNWYACPNLILHGRIGHGLESEIVLADGSLTSTAFKSMAAGSLGCKAIYYNSCLVHNPPLDPAIMGAGAQIFIGGNVNLYIGPSEEVFKCWMQRTLVKNEVMQPNVLQCEKDTGYQQGDHGVSRDAKQPDKLCLAPPEGPQVSFSYELQDRTVSFADTSTNPTATNRSWRWDFGDNASSTVQNPTHAYGADGVYSVALTVTDDAGKSSSATRTLKVPFEPEYCASSGDDVSYFWIKNVAVGDFSHASEAAPYTDLTTQVIPLSAGEAVPLTLARGGAANYINWYRIWIDLNRDGDFEDQGELLFDTASAIKGDATGALTLPATAAPRTTRMRVSMKNKDAPTPCDSFRYGAVVDYSVAIRPAR